MKRHIFSTVVVSATLISLFLACQAPKDLEDSEHSTITTGSTSQALDEITKDSASNALSGNPLVQDEDLDKLLSPAGGSIKVMTNVTGGKDAEEMKLFEETIHKDTGLEVSIERPASDYDQILMQKLVANEALDLIQFNTPTMVELVAQGVLTDLTDRIKESKLLGNPDIVASSEWDDISIDGKLYAGFNKKEVMRLPVINAVIAKKADVDIKDIPPTLNGYTEVFRKMKKVAGENFYGLNLVLADVWDLQPWFASLGLKTGIVLENDKFTVPIATEESAPVWDWLVQLYEENLLDPDAATDSSSDMRNKFQSGRTAVVTDWAAWVGLYNVNAGAQYPDSFEAVGLPGTHAPSGEPMLARGDASLFGIPVHAENPDGAFRLLEYFATKHGGDLLSIGIEGHDWVVENGEVKLTEIGEAHGKDHGAPIPIHEGYESPVPLNPGFLEALEYLTYASTEISNDKTNDYKEIVGRNGIQIVQGQVTVEDGLEQMRQELMERDVISP